MSLLKKPELNTRWKKLLLVAVSLLLLVPCIAAASLAMRFDVDTKAQEPTTQEKERKEKVEKKMRDGREIEEMKERMASDPQFREELERKQKLEMEMREIRQAALVRLAKINMDQAIQIATSQQPGKLARDGVVFYHVIIANEGDAGSTYIWVNAIDGTIIKTEKELPRKMRSLKDSDRF